MPFSDVLGYNSAVEFERENKIIENTQQAAADALVKMQQVNEEYKIAENAGIALQKYVSNG